MIPDTARTVFVRSSKTVKVVNLEELNPKACRYFPKYKGMRMPTCRCRPCMEVFLEAKAPVVYSEKTMAELFIGGS